MHTFHTGFSKGDLRGRPHGPTSRTCKARGFVRSARACLLFLALVYIHLTNITASSYIPWTQLNAKTKRARRDGTLLTVLLCEQPLTNLQDQGQEGRRGYVCRCIPRSVSSCAFLCWISDCGGVGREAASKRRCAIKKIKVGQFKDGLDMSAIREVKYLRELKHINVIEVGPVAELCSALADECSSWTSSRQSLI